jgi:hypothetical protein
MNGFGAKSSGFGGPDVGWDYKKPAIQLSGVVNKIKNTCIHKRLITRLIHHTVRIAD